jgi:hypothetical protein
LSRWASIAARTLSLSLSPWCSSGEVAGEYAQAIRDHLPAIVGIVAGFIMAEAVSAFLAAPPPESGRSWPW